MDSSLHNDTINIDCPLYTLKGHSYTFLNYDIVLSLEVVLILENSADPDEYCISSGSSLFAKVPV